jgi:succinate-semialdehyde dehydrogenase/glutarate-semialdehyde dehydrogenase
MPFTSRDPFTEEVTAQYEAHSPEETERRLGRADDAFRALQQTSAAERSGWLRAAARMLEERSGEFAALMTTEMGKPLAQAKAEAEKCAWVCRYYADEAEAMLADEPVATDAARSYVAYQPLGPVLAVMPWNYPFWQVMRFAAPALAAGNVGLLKHAANVTGCALAIEALFAEAGAPKGAFQALLIGHDQTAEVIADRRVRAVTLTGSGRGGSAVAAQAGKHLKPCVLELGGSDAFIVLDDADLDRAVEIGLKSRMQNNGQSCIAAKRFVVERGVLDAFTERFAAAAEALTLGDPRHPDTDLGPLAREDLRDGLHEQVQQAQHQGARVLTGGEVPDRTGYFYPPTVLAGVEPGMVPFDDELFGPVASIVAARDAEDAVALANRSRFGLGGAVFTRDLERGERIARRLEVGCAFVNQLVGSDPRLPFGGVKDSGYGRELSRHGLRAFTNAKTVWVEV